MKACAYCGRQNGDEALHCGECGTPIAAEVAPTRIDVLNWSPKSPGGIAIATGLAALFLCSAAYFVVGGALFALLQPPNPASSFADSPGGFTLAFFMPAPLGVFLLAVAAAVTFVACKARCRKRWHGIATTIITVGLLTLFKIAPGFWCVSLPVLLAFLTQSPIGFYFGTALQAGVGVWLLGWFRKREQNEIQPVQ